MGQAIHMLIMFFKRVVRYIKRGAEEGGGLSDTGSPVPLRIVPREQCVTPTHRVHYVAGAIIAATTAVAQLRHQLVFKKRDRLSTQIVRLVSPLPSHSHPNTLSFFYQPVSHTITRGTTNFNVELCLLSSVELFPSHLSVMSDLSSLIANQIFPFLSCPLSCFSS